MCPGRVDDERGGVAEVAKAFAAQLGATEPTSHDDHRSDDVFCPEHFEDDPARPCLSASPGIPIVFVLEDPTIGGG